MRIWARKNFKPLTRAARASKESSSWVRKGSSVHTLLRNNGVIPIIRGIYYIIKKSLVRLCIRRLLGVNVGPRNGASAAITP